MNHCDHSLEHRLKSSAAGGEQRGFDGGKKLKGRKGHILVDTEGFVLSRRTSTAPRS